MTATEKKSELMEEMIQAAIAAAEEQGAHLWRDDARGVVTAILEIVERDYEPHRCDDPSWAGHRCTKPRGHDSIHEQRFSGTVWP